MRKLKLNEFKENKAKNSTKDLEFKANSDSND